MQRADPRLEGKEATVMTQVRRRTIGMPDLIVTILRLPDRLTADTVREMQTAELYILAGATMSRSGLGTGFGAYVGTSGALNQQLARSGVSLRQWAFSCGRLRPEVVVLINRRTRPMDPSTRLLIEASLARAICSRYSLLNIRTAAPRAALAATRHQRLWAQHTSDRLAGLVLGRVFHRHPSAPEGGTTREQLVRLVLGQQHALNVSDVLRMASRAGLIINGSTPAQRTRRDLLTRERDGATGRPRLVGTHIGGLAIVYNPAQMTLRQARADYFATHPDAPRGPRHIAAPKRQTVGASAIRPQRATYPAIPA